MRWDVEIEEIKKKFSCTDLGFANVVLDSSFENIQFGINDDIPVKICVKSQQKRVYSWKDIEYWLNYLSQVNATVSVVEMFKDLKERIECCPASTKHHGSYFGGLLDHIIPVAENAVKLGNMFGFSAMEIHSLINVVLLHDVGKLGDRHHEMFIINPDFSKHDKEPFVYNENLIKLPHEMYSLWWCNHYGIYLTPEEFQAIAYHNGPYKDSYMNSVASKENKLLLVLHAADNLTAKLCENTITKTQR